MIKTMDFNFLKPDLFKKKKKRDLFGLELASLSLIDPPIYILDFVLLHIK